MKFSTEWNTGLRNGSADEICFTLKSLSLSGMAEALREQTDNPDKYEAMSFTERLGDMLLSETDRRINNCLKRRLKEAQLFIPEACMEKLDTNQSRTMDIQLVYKLGSCSYIAGKKFVSIEGATGTGKTFLASAFANAACRNGYAVRCVRFPDLLNEMAVARSQGTTATVKASYIRYNLVVIDDWLLYPIDTRQSSELLDFVDGCNGKTSLIFCTQYARSQWYHRLDVGEASKGESPLAEALLDRLIHNVETLSLTSQKSLREQYTVSGESREKKNEETQSK